MDPGPDDEAAAPRSNRVAGALWVVTIASLLLAAGGAYGTVRAITQVAERDHIIEELRFEIKDVEHQEAELSLRVQKEREQQLLELQKCQAKIQPLDPNAPRVGGGAFDPSVLAPAKPPPCKCVPGDPICTCP